MSALAAVRGSREELLETIRTQRRQLQRYLFYFEKDRYGVFVASDRPKFGLEEMLQPGCCMEWSLKDLLCHLIDWEGRFLRWVRAGLEGELPGDVPPADLQWEGMDPDDHAIPEELGALPVHRVLAELNDSHQRVVTALAAIPEEALFDAGYYAWTGEASVAEYAALCTHRHDAWAKGLVRRWRSRHAGEYLNKEALLERVRAERRRLEQNLERLNEEEMEVAGVVGKWTVKDLLAHLADWEQRFVGWYRAGLRGEVPETPAPGIGWEELDELNRRIYEKHRHRTLEDVRQEFSASYGEVLAVVEGMAEEEIFAVGRYAWLGESNLLAYILANTAHHYRWAKEMIRRWIGGE